MRMPGKHLAAAAIFLIVLGVAQGEGRDGGPASRTPGRAVADRLSRLDRADRHDAGLIVAGARGLSALESLVLGSVSHGIAQQARSDPSALEMFVDGQPADDHDRHRLRHVAPDAARGFRVRDGAYCQCMIADYLLPGADHVRT